MNMTISKLFRPRKNGHKAKAGMPIADGATAPPPKSVDELRIELRARLDEAGHGYFELGDLVVDDAVRNCRVFANRHRGIESLPKGGIVAEVGTQTGRFANDIYNSVRPDKLHLFDLSLELFDKSFLVEPIRDGKVQIHLGDSSTELNKFPDEHFDWLYIDGDHSYGGVKRDMAAAMRVVKHDGLLVFNDYAIWSPLEVVNYGVLKAVNELVNTRNWEFVYLALHPWGYHDVAIRRCG